MAGYESALCIWGENLFRVKKGEACGKHLPHSIKKKIATTILLTLRRIFLFRIDGQQNVLKS